jgi:hypothetical protein
VQLKWVGNGGWRACDAAVPENDARCLIAYVECVDHHVEVTWMNARPKTTSFPTLREAYAAIDGALQ